MKFEIRNRWSGNVQFTAEIDCSEDTPLRIKVGLAAKWAFKSGADLSGAVLSGADLRGADLRGAVLSGAVLRDAVLRDAYGTPFGGMPTGWKLNDNGLWVKA